MTVLLIAEHDAGTVKRASLKALTCAQEIAAGADVVALVYGSGAQEAAAALKNFGVSKVFTAEGELFENPVAESLTAAAVEAQKASGATFVLAAASSASKDSLPRVAVRLNAGMASDIMTVVSPSTFTRPMWAGNVIATVEIPTDIKVATVRATEFALPAEAAGAGDVEALAIPLELGGLKSKFVSRTEVKSERPDVTSASRVVSGGRGVKSAEGFKVIEDLADSLGAGVGASRAVCDAGWVANDLQIGQTGKVVAPDLYIAVGLSGAIQHLAGMKGSKVIVAINKDPEAPIFQVADYGLVADLFQAVPELVKAIGE